MKLTPIEININEYPLPLQPLLENAVLYDSSSSKDARVIFIDKDEGYFLKIAESGLLETEYKMTSFFSGKGLAAKEVAYFSEHEQDFLLTSRVKGDDCVAEKYLRDPKRLCDTLAETLLMLHSSNGADCPVQNHTKRYLSVVRRNFDAKQFDMSFYDGTVTPDQLYGMIQRKSHILQCDTLIHGDFCLPNVILNDWNLSGFVDVGNGGMGDRHVDLFWGAWTLKYNLHTDEYRDRFFDAYGRDKIDDELLMLISACEVFG